MNGSFINFLCSRVLVVQERGDHLSKRDAIIFIFLREFSHLNILMLFKWQYVEVQVTIRHLNEGDNETIISLVNG